MNIDNVTDDDDQALHLIEHFKAANTFIENARVGGGVVIHCAAGISRSTTITLAYLMMRENGLSLLDAFEQVYRARRVIWPNNGFMSKLIELDASLRGGQLSFTLEQYTEWGEFDIDSYNAAKIVDRASPQCS